MCQTTCRDFTQTKPAADLRSKSVHARRRNPHLPMIVTVVISLSLSLGRWRRAWLVLELHTLNLLLTKCLCLPSRGFPCSPRGPASSGRSHVVRYGNVEGPKKLNLHWVVGGQGWGGGGGDGCRGQCSDIHCIRIEVTD